MKRFLQALPSIFSETIEPTSETVYPVIVFDATTKPSAPPEKKVRLGLLDRILWRVAMDGFVEPT